ncbi:MAG: prepilin-type N-terminal cleavage/methylation domain-containing protein [Pirellulaceae bacterium]
MNDRLTRRLSRRGFTLFEVLVALGLSVVLMAMIGFAIQFYAQQLNVRDSEARRTQLARSILRMIAEDLQACVYPQEFDAGALAEVLASSATGAATGASSSSAGDSTDDSVVVEEEGDATMEATAISDSLASTERPGLIGNQFQIQFDVSRLPRLEEYLPMLTNPTDVGIEDLPSDVKTVAYFVQQAGLTGVGDNVQRIAEGSQANFETKGGLVRRSLSRELTRYASESGDINRLNQTGDLIAPEVLQIEFAYFDGTQWLFEWNSDENKMLPMAVQIRLSLRKEGVDAEPVAGADLGLATALNSNASADVYDLMVRLPMATVVSPDETAEDDLSAAGL